MAESASTIDTGSGGLKKVQHGVTFQLNLLMLFVLRAINNNYYKFSMGTEVTEAEKFDDVVFQYKRSVCDKYNCRLLQAKHKKDNNSTKIKKNDLLSRNDKNDYSMQKYFKSFLKIKNRCVENSIQSISIFNDCTLEDLMICTNIDFETALKHDFDIVQLDNDELLKINNKDKYPNAALCTLKRSPTNEFKKQLEWIFEITSDFYKLVEELADCICILNKAPNIKNSDIFESYRQTLNSIFDIVYNENNSAFYGDTESKNFRDALLKEIEFRETFHDKKLYTSNKFPKMQWPNKVDKIESFAKSFANAIKTKTELTSEKFPLLPLVIEKSNGELKADFFKPQSIVNNSLKIFRHIFIRELNSKCTMDLASVKIKLSTTFPDTIENIQKFAEQICKCRNGSVIIISEENLNLNKSNFKSNVEKIARYLLEKKDKRIHFKTHFLNGNELCGNFDQFRNELRKLGKEYYNSFTKCEFVIKDDKIKASVGPFKKLPILHVKNDIEEFFEKMKFIINYPNQEDIINDIIEAEIKITHHSFDVDAFKSQFYVELYQWMAKTKGTLFTKDDFELVSIKFNKHIKINKICERSESYIESCSEVYTFNDYGDIKTFLSNKHQQILHLIFEDMSLGRSRVVQTYKNLKKNNQGDSSEIKKYIEKGDAIFINAVKCNEDVLECFEDSETGNLLVLEWDNETEIENFNKFIAKLKNDDNKKIIFITKQNFQLRNELSEAKYEEKVCTTNFNDLNGDAQQKVRDQEIIFQGEKIKLANLVAENEKDFIDTNILIELSKKSEIELDCCTALNLKDNTHIIDRKYDLSIRKTIYNYMFNKINIFNDIFVTNSISALKQPRIIHRLNLLISFAKYGLDQNYNFQLGTLIEENKIFIVFKYFKNNKKQYYVAKKTFYEAIFNENATLMLIFNEFLEYCTIKKLISGEECNKFLAFYTDYDYKSNDMIRTYFKENTRAASKIEPENWYKTTYTISSFEIRSYLTIRCEIYALAQVLIYCILKEPTGEERKLLKRYQSSLLREVINISDKKFHNNFVNDILLTAPASHFRKDIVRAMYSFENIDSFQKIFGIEHKEFLNKVKVDQFYIEKLIKNVTLHTGFNSDIQINVDDSFVSLLVNKIYSKDFHISNENLRDINTQLIGHVLIPVSQTELRFSTLFLSDFYILPDYITIFKLEFKEKIRKGYLDVSFARYWNNITFTHEINEFDFTSYVYGKVEIDDFLKKFVLAKKTSYDIHINHVLQEKFREEYYFLQDFIVHWMQKQNSRSHYISGDEIKNQMKEYIRKDSNASEDVIEDEHDQCLDQFKYFYIINLVMLILNEVKTNAFRNYSLNIYNYFMYEELMYKYTDKDDNTNLILVKFILKKDVTKKIKAGELFQAIVELYKLFTEAYCPNLSSTAVNLKLNEKDRKFIIYSNASFDDYDCKVAQLEFEQIEHEGILYTGLGKKCNKNQLNFKLTSNSFDKLLGKIRQRTEKYIIATQIINFLFSNDDLFCYTDCYKMLVEKKLNHDTNFTLDFDKLKKYFEDYLILVLREKVYKTQIEELQGLTTDDVTAIRNNNNEALEILHRIIQGKPLEVPGDINKVIKINLDTTDMPTYYFGSKTIILFRSIKNIFKLKTRLPVMADDNRKFSIALLHIINADVIKFNPIFLNHPSKLNRTSKYVRNLLKYQLHRYRLSLKDLSNCKILIDRFRLPYTENNYNHDDVSDFLKALVFSVDQPTSIELNNILKGKLNRTEFYSFQDFVLNRKSFLVNASVEDFNKNFERRVLYYHVRLFNDTDICETKPFQWIIAPEENFENIYQLFTKYSAYNIHFLKEEQDKILWHSTKGSLVEIKDYIDEDEINMLNSHLLDDALVIIAAEPGMGKSTILNSLHAELKRRDPSVWIIKIDLNRCSNKLRNQEKNWKFEDIVAFLMSVKKLSSGFQEKFLRFQLETHGNIVLLFDGLDEIEPKQQKIVISLLKTLSNYKVKQLWIATRLHLREEIEEELSKLSYTIIPFSKKDQINYLKKNWKNLICQLNKNTEVNDSRLELYIDKLLSWFKNSINTTMRDLLGIPLQIKLLGEVYQESCLLFYDSDKNEPEFDKSINLNDLYERFIESKFNIYFKEKLKSELRDVHEQDTKKNSMNRHIYYAFKELFPFEKSFISKLNILSSQDEDFYENELKLIGIVQSEKNYVSFIHRTFAEYFVAQYLAENISSGIIYEFVRTHIWKKENKVIRIFLDRSLLKSDKIFTHILNNDVNSFGIDFDIRSINKCDVLGRTALHLAVVYNYEEIVKYLLDKNANVNIYDNILHWSPIMYAIYDCNSILYKLLLAKGTNPDDILFFREPESEIYDSLKLKDFIDTQIKN